MCDPAPVIETPCSNCGGEGFVDYRVLGINYHDGSLIETWRTCEVCGGDGWEVIEAESVTEEERMDDHG